MFFSTLECAEFTYEQRELAQDIFTLSHKRKKEQRERIEYEFTSVESKDNSLAVFKLAALKEENPGSSINLQAELIISISHFWF